MKVSKPRSFSIFFLTYTLLYFQAVKFYLNTGTQIFLEVITDTWRDIFFATPLFLDNYCYPFKMWHNMKLREDARSDESLTTDNFIETWKNLCGMFQNYFMLFHAS